MDNFSSKNYQDIVDSVMESTFTGMDKDSLFLIEQALLMEKPSLYCLKYKPIRRKPLTFYSTRSPYKHRPWQVAILDDHHPNKVTEKSRQLGLSEIGISECIWFLDIYEDTKAMYTFPRDQQMKDFSNTRITPVFAESPYLNVLLQKDINNMALKKIGNSYLFMRSAWGSALGEGIDIDYLCFDEYDRMRENVELAFEEGLKSSKYGWLRRWSTPTIPGRGINLAFQKSDQMRYIWTCEHCGEKQFLTFEDNLVQVKPKGVNHITQEIEPGTFIIGCKKCKKEINRWGEGEWVAQYPSHKSIRGYHISQLDATWISADSIMKRQFDYPSKQLFRNYVIGEPYASEGLVIDEQDILDSIRLPKWASARPSSGYTHICVGIDWGQTNWMVILGLKPDRLPDLLAVHWAEDNPIRPLEPVSYFTAILRAYKPEVIIADAGYGADRNSFLYTQFPYALYACQWQTIKDTAARVKFKSRWNESEHEVIVDKTTTMQRMLHKLKGRAIGMPPIDEKLAVLTKHLKNIRIMDMEEDGIVYQVATRIGPDHLGCCLAYALLGVDKITNYNTSVPFGYEFI